MRRDDGGEFWDTVFDVVSLVSSIVEVVANPTDAWAWAGLAGDVVDLIPFVSDVGEATDLVRVAKNTSDLNHSFPLMIDKFVDLNNASILIGNDKIQRYIVQIPGYINNRFGVFEYIIDFDGWCNHRFFKELK